MALITSCQATFQNFSGYEDDLASLEENIRECYSEITKTSEQINMSVREEFISRSEMETIQKDFETSITQSSTEIRMDFTTITDEIKENVSTNQLLLEEYIRFKGALIELGKVGNAFTAELSNEELAFKENGQKIAYISNQSLVITNAEIRNTSYPSAMKAGGGLILYREPMGTFQSNGEVPSKMLRNGRGENDGIQRQFFRFHPGWTL